CGTGDGRDVHQPTSAPTRAAHATTSVWACMPVVVRRPPQSASATLSLARLRPHLMAVTIHRRPLGARPSGPRPPRGSVAWPLRPVLLLVIMAAAGVSCALPFL